MSTFEEDFQKAMQAIRKSHLRTRETKGTEMIRVGRSGPRGDFKPSQQWFLIPSRTDEGFAIKVNRGGRLIAIAIQGMGRNIDYTVRGKSVDVFSLRIPPEVYNRVRELFERERGWREPATPFPRGVSRK